MIDKPIFCGVVVAHATIAGALHMLKVSVLSVKNTLLYFVHFLVFTHDECFKVHR
jgi:hypothetical protein